MDFKILSLYILGCFLVVPSIFIILDLGRISIFLFYEKEKKQLRKKTMLQPIVGNSVYALKNILIVCILLPSVLLLYYSGEVFKNFFGLLAYYGLATTIFFIITFSSYLGIKLQIETQTRAHAKYLFVVNLLLLIAWFSLTMLYFNKISFMI